MSKRLPYFQFEPAEWLAGDIMFCSLSAQGLFTTLKALYWQKDCDLTLEQAIKRLKNKELFDELISENIIKVFSGKIQINFLDEQFKVLSERSKINSKNGALGGRPKKQNETEKKPNGFDSLKRNESETKAYRKEEKKEEDNKIKEYNNIPEIKNFGSSDFNDCNFLHSKILKNESPSWLESVSMQQKMPIEEIKNKIDDFVLFLKTTETQHKVKKAFLEHFINWLPKNLKQSRGPTKDLITKN